MYKEEIVVVWFKRDLRLHDHHALANAITSGKRVLPIYIFEPSIMSGADQDIRHHRFIYESIVDLNQRLSVHGKQIMICWGEAIDVFRAILKEYSITAVYSHQETGNANTFQRDKSIGAFLRKANISWYEELQWPVYRRLKNRGQWGARMNAYLADAQVIIGDHHWEKIIGSKILETSFCLPEEQKKVLEQREKQMQCGGETKGLRYFVSFLKDRHVNYYRHISKPEQSRTSCSRLSPYIAYGCLSMRMVVQYTRQEILDNPTKKRSLNQFLTRLHWQSHFVQKFEQECEMEFRPVNRGYEIEYNTNTDWINAWKDGKTGYPLVDACMRCVKQTGYLNFRMRAMVVSFFVHNLGQDWKIAALHLARMFLDYEPGIHYPQIQMQAGITGINTLRMYNVVKQSYDHDPDGVFIKKWIPELRGVPTDRIHEPWKMKDDQAECDVNYPIPIVDHEATLRAAKLRLAEIRNKPTFKQEAGRILAKLTNPNRTEETRKRKKKLTKKQPDLFTEMREEIN